MIPDNVAKSVDAAEQALGHFAHMLEQGGFAAGADAYDRLADVIVSQAMMLQAEEEHGLDDRFRLLEALAAKVHAQLHPYVDAMERLLALQEIVPAAADTIDQDTVAGKIVATLKESTRPLSLTAIRSSVGGSNRAVRDEVEGLLEAGVVERSGSPSRPVYALAN